MKLLIVAAASLLALSYATSATYAQANLPWCLDIPEEGSKAALLAEKRSLFQELTVEMSNIRKFVQTASEQQDFKFLQDQARLLESRAGQAISPLPQDFSLCLFPTPQTSCEQIPVRSHKVLGPTLANVPNLLERALRIVTPSIGKGFEPGSLGALQRRLSNRINELREQLNLVPPVVFLCT
jgi:hypothetical protein